MDRFYGFYCSYDCSSNQTSSCQQKGLRANRDIVAAFSIPFLIFDKSVGGGCSCCSTNVATNCLGFYVVHHAVHTTREPAVHGFSFLMHCSVLLCSKKVFPTRQAWLCSKKVFPTKPDKHLCQHSNQEPRTTIFKEDDDANECFETAIPSSSAHTKNQPGHRILVVHDRVVVGKEQSACFETAV